VWEGSAKRRLPHTQCCNALRPRCSLREPRTPITAQVNLYNYTNLRYAWSPTQAVGLQASAGVVLACSNALGPRLLGPLIGQANVMRVGMAGFAAAMVAMGMSVTGPGFAASVIASSVATMCLPGLTGLVAAEAQGDEAAAMLTALDSMSTLDRLVAYKAMSYIFARGIGWGLLGAHFYAGTACVLLGWVALEVALSSARDKRPAGRTSTIESESFPSRTSGQIVWK